MGTDITPYLTTEEMVGWTGQEGQARAVAKWFTGKAV